ncbi:uncharacterized protein LOC120353061 [Nilaparvata lugens]|uniref:uncharacterized protein LOC120353061 n=1 Tax=Nilaparvata lugens TaxID=108931 RepID=UPI00193D522A|nr:uncharacterized protein LOC120353061 [Nilaparvata lugens]
MLKVMNLLILTLSMNILMSISSNARITNADRGRCREIFNDIDDDKNGLITEEDVSSVFSDPEKSQKLDGMILEKEEFKNALLNRLKTRREMNLDAFVTYLYNGESFEARKRDMQKLFPQKTVIQREEIYRKEVFESLRDYNLKESYTIEEFTLFYFINHELI